MLVRAVAGRGGGAADNGFRSPMVISSTPPCFHSFRNLPPPLPSPPSPPHNHHQPSTTTAAVHDNPGRVKWFNSVEVPHWGKRVRDRCHRDKRREREREREKSREAGEARTAQCCCFPLIRLPVLYLARVCVNKRSCLMVAFICFSVCRPLEISPKAPKVLFCRRRRRASFSGGPFKRSVKIAFLSVFISKLHINENYFVVVVVSRRCLMA